MSPWMVEMLGFAWVVGLTAMGIYAGYERKPSSAAR